MLRRLKKMGKNNEPSKEEPPPKPAPQRPRFNLPSIVEPGKLKKKRPYSVYDEVYCDKDRAAAVSIGLGFSL